MFQDSAADMLREKLRADREQLFRALRSEIRDERVLRAMARVPRELFVPENKRHVAYEDRPLPIEAGQTISQPFIVALMTEALELTGREKVLEVGSGSGYQAAILGELAREVISVERIPALADRAGRILHELGYTNIKVYVAERTLGWRAEAPYDAIIVTAAAPSVPQELVDQLATNGVMVIPVGLRWEQDLLKIRKKDGLAVVHLTPCRFVPLMGEGAWEEGSTE